MQGVGRVTSAFLSYGHEDQRIARLLERDLRKLARPVFGRARIRIVRDQLNLQPTSDLWAAIRAQLDACDQLVLLASQSSAKSEWVNREVEHFIQKRGTAKIVLVAVDGELRWNRDTKAFDPAATNALSPAVMKHYTAEPLYVGLHWAVGADAPDSDARWRAALLDIASAVTGLDKESVAAADAVVRRRALPLGWGAATGLALLATVATIFGVFAYVFGQRAEARLHAAQEHVGELLTVVDSELTQLRGAGNPRRVLLQQSRVLLERMGTPETAAALRTGDVLATLEASSSGSEASQVGDAVLATARQTQAVQLAAKLESTPSVGARMAAATAYMEAGTSAFAIGDLATAATQLERARMLRERLARESPEPARTLDLAVAIDRLGRARFRQGQHEAAKQLHLEGKRIVETLPASDTRTVALAESELLLFDVALVQGENDVIEYLLRAETLLGEVVDQSRLDIARRRLDIDLRAQSFAKIDTCPQILTGAFSLFASEGTGDDAARFGDAIAVCPAYDDALLNRTSALRSKLETSQQHAPRLYALLVAVEGQARARQNELPAARELLLRASKSLEELVANARDAPLEAALARTYSYLMNLPSNDGASILHWYARCVELSQGSLYTRRRLDCLISVAPALISGAVSEPGPARTILDALARGFEEAKVIDDGSDSGRLRRFQLLRLAAVAAKWARDPAQVQTYLARADAVVAEQERADRTAAALPMMRASLEETRRQSAALPH